MLVTGSIDIAADGSVEGHKLDQQQALPPVVSQLISEAVSAWRFEPVKVDGRSVRARTQMTVRVVAKKQDDGNFQVGIRSASFGTGAPGSAADIKAKSMPPPRFPEAAYRMGVKGTVYVILRISPQGTVEDAFAEQVNLKVVGDERQMARGRDLLSKSALQAAKAWRFEVPIPDAADDGFQLVRVPIEYAWVGDTSPEHGKWETYVPGPTNKAPWILEEIDPSFSPDAQIAGTLQRVGNGPRLLTPLKQG